MIYRRMRRAVAVAVVERKAEERRSEERKATNHSTGFLRVDGLHEEGVSGEGGPT